MIESLFLFIFKPMISRKKIYYVPGLISALLIPVLFWYFGNRKLNEPIPNVMDLGIPSKYDPNIPLNQQITFEPLRNWNYQKIIVMPGTAKQNSSLYVSEIKKMQKRNEKNSGIEFILDHNNSYGDFASILNDLAIAKHEIYSVDLEKTGHVFAVVDYKDPNKIEEPCYLCNDTMAYYPYEPKGYYKFQEILKELPENAFYIIFGFLILLNISMLSIKESLQIH